MPKSKPIAKKSTIHPSKTETDPAPAGTDPAPAGTDPAPAGTDPAPTGTDPAPTGTDPAPTGTDPEQEKIADSEERTLTPIDKEMRHIGLFMRYGIEAWKEQMLGEKFLKDISRAFIAHKLDIPFNMDVLFKRIETFGIEITDEIETFEKKLFPEIETYLAKKKAKK